MVINKLHHLKGQGSLLLTKSINIDKEKASNAKIVNGFHVTVMILMASGLNDAYPT
jgi:hypothetical protein